MEVIDKRKGKFVESIKSMPIIKKLAGIKNIQLIVAIFIIAVALIIYSNVGSESKQVDSVSVQSTMSDEEQKLASILEDIDGVGDVNVLITRNNDEIVGILILAEGANDISVMLRLQSATVTAMGVDKNIVDVYEKK